MPLIDPVAQSFKKLSRGLKALEKSAEGFKSKNILGLLRSAPDLMPNIKHVQEMFVQGEKEKGSSTNFLCPSPSDDADVTTPQALMSFSQWPGKTRYTTKCKRRLQRGSGVWRRS